MHLRGWRSFQNPSGSRAEQCGTADIFHTLNRLYSTLSPQHVEWGVEVIKLGILAILSNFIFFSLFDIKEVFGSQFQEKVNEGELQLSYLLKKKKKKALEPMATQHAIPYPGTFIDQYSCRCPNLQMLISFI